LPNDTRTVVPPGSISLSGALSLSEQDLNTGKKIIEKHNRKRKSSESGLE